MTKLIAIHSLHLAAAVAGQVDLVAPGQAFIAREDELYLAKGDNGAARLATEEDKGAKLAVRLGASAASADVPDDISKLNKAQLIALAAAEEIAIDETATNKVIVETIVAGRKAKDEDAI